MAGQSFYTCKFRDDDGQPDVMGLDTVSSSPFATNSGRMSIKALLTAEVRDRQGDVLLVDGGEFDSHRLSGVVLLDHGKNHNLPIGKTISPEGIYTVEVMPDAGEIWYEAFLSQKSRMAAQVYELAEEGIICGSSPGFRPIEVEDLPEDPERGFFTSWGPNGERRPAGKLIRRWELCEISIAGVPVNQEAARMAVTKSWAGQALAPAIMEPWKAWLPEPRAVVVGGWDGASAAKAWDYADTLMAKAALPIGHTSQRADGPYKKVAEGRWEKVTEGGGEAPGEDAPEEEPRQDAAGPRILSDEEMAALSDEELEAYLAELEGAGDEAPEAEVAEEEAPEEVEEEEEVEDDGPEEEASEDEQLDAEWEQAIEAYEADLAPRQEAYEADFEAWEEARDKALDRYEKDHAKWQKKYDKAEAKFDADLAAWEKRAEAAREKYNQAAERFEEQSIEDTLGDDSLDEPDEDAFLEEAGPEPEFSDYFADLGDEPQEDDYTAELGDEPEAPVDDLGDGLRVADKLFNPSDARTGPPAADAMRMRYQLEREIARAARAKGGFDMVSAADIEALAREIIQQRQAQTASTAQSAAKAWGYLPGPSAAQEAGWMAAKAWGHVWSEMELEEKARVLRQEGETWTTASGNKYTKTGGKIRRVYEGKRRAAKQDNGAEGGEAREEEQPAPEKKPKPDVEGAFGRIEEMKAAGKAGAKDMHELAGELLGLTVAQLTELKKRLGLKASGVKYELASKLAAGALRAADTKRNKEKADGGRQRPDGRAGSERTAPADAGAGGEVAGETERPASAGADQERGAADKPATATTARPAERVPASAEEIGRRLDRFEKFFEAKSQHHVAGWMRTLKDHISAVGGEAALAALAQSASGGEGKGDVQYWGVGTEEANWRNMGHFMEAYLARNGIIAVTGDTSSPDAPLVSALGAPDRYVAGDFKPEGMHFKDKLSEAKTLPGLEASEDISKVMGKPVTHLTDEVTAKLDEQYGKGQWIVKCYDDNAAAGYGIFFPQRAQAIAQDARNTIWDAGGALAKYGFELRRDDAGQVVGLKHSSGDTYDFGTEKYQKTIDGDARHWGDRAANAAHHEKGAMLPEGSFMVQPAFKAVGISDAERAAGKTWHEKNEGRVHLVTRPDGTVEVIPHSTWLKGGSLPVVFEDDDTRAMAQAAKEAIEKIPPEARKGQVYAPDIMKTADGYRVVELNAQGDNNGSGYLHDNHFTIDAYTSYLTGRTPAHVAFIRQLLTKREKPKKGGE